MDLFVAYYCCSLESIFLELKYSSHPDYIEALKKLDADPDNVILQMEEQKE